MLVYNNLRVTFGIDMLVAKARFLLFYTQLVKIWYIKTVIVNSESAIVFFMTKKKLRLK